MDRLEQIKENIRTINPELTDEVLDLLYEYVMRRFAESLPVPSYLEETTF